LKAIAVVRSFAQAFQVNIILFEKIITDSFAMGYVKLYVLKPPFEHCEIPLLTFHFHQQTNQSHNQLFFAPLNSKFNIPCFARYFFGNYMCLTAMLKPLHVIIYGSINFRHHLPLKKIYVHQRLIS
jgi:hypothetical protein